jgi:hypothetical protein
MNRNPFTLRKNLCHILAISQDKGLHRLIARIDNPVFPDTCLKIQVKLHQPVLPGSRRRKNFNHQIRSSMDTMFIYFTSIADHEKIRLDYSINILRSLSFLFKKADIERGIVCAPWFPGQI